MIQTRIPNDNGPIYTETINHLNSGSDHWLVEPYNAVSAVLFVIVAAYWLWRLRGQYRDHKFVVYGLSFLTIGGIGGTLYHALRTEPIYLLMDWMPIVILSLSITYWFFAKLTRHRWLALLYMSGGFAAVWFSFFLMVRMFGWGKIAGSIGYSMIALQAIAPIVVYLFKTRFRHSVWFFAGTASFALAAIFRATDHDGFLPMGTHFLWHAFGAVMAAFLLEFIYRVEREVKSAAPSGSLTERQISGAPPLAVGSDSSTHN